MPYVERKVEKLYYPIGEVASILDLPVSTVRFWENEFEILKPKKNKKGNRLFTAEDLRNLKIIHHLLREKGMTIAGAKMAMLERGNEIDKNIEISDTLKGIRSMIVELIDSM